MKLILINPRRTKLSTASSSHDGYTLLALLEAVCFFVTATRKHKHSPNYVIVPIFSL